MKAENKFGVPYSRRDIINIKAEGSQPKRKAQTTSIRNSKQRKIIEHAENFDLEVRKIALKERELQIRAQEAALAEAEAMELNNRKKEIFKITLESDIKYNL
jgi:hypothetical protein